MTKKHKYGAINELRELPDRFKKKKKRQSNPKVPYEDVEQKKVFDWSALNEKRYPDLELLNGSLNGFRLTPSLRLKAKQQGLKKGYPDIFLPVRNGEFSGLFIELKRIKGGSVSLEQKEFLKRLNEQGFRAVVCKGHKAAIEVIENYLLDKE